MILEDSFLERLRHWIHTLLHLWKLLALATPVVLTAPLALLSSSFAPSLEETWWDLAVHFAQFSSPTLIKFMQWASSRRDMFPASFCDHFQRFHEKVPEHSWKFTEHTLNEAFGREWSEILEIEKESIGSGCIAQVYRGKLKSDGRLVAVKVIHPNVKRMVELDLGLMQRLVSFLEIFPLLRWVGARESVAEFSNVMLRQLNLRTEAESLEHFRRNFAGRSGIRFPKPYMEYSSENVLLESLEEGVHFHDFVATCKGVKKKKMFARVILDSYLKMVFLDNFAHGDLHPGNLLFDLADDSAKRTNKHTECVVAVDAGIVTRLEQKDLHNFVQVFHAVVTGNGHLAGELIVSQSNPTIITTTNGERVEQRCKNIQAFCEGMNEIVSEALHWNLGIRKVHVGKLLKRVMELCCEQEVHLEGKYASIVISIAVLESIGRVLDPDIDVLSAALPIILQSKLRLHSGRVVGKEG